MNSRVTKEMIPYNFAHGAISSHSNPQQPRSAHKVLAAHILSDMKGYDLFYIPENGRNPLRFKVILLENGEALEFLGSSLHSQDEAELKALKRAINVVTKLA